MRITESKDRTKKITYPEGYHSVIIPVKEKNALCVSCQIGCPVGCKFCFSGKSFKRNLNAKEIIQQFEKARELLGRDPNTVVFMGMGEPSLNIKEVKTAAEYFHEQGLGYNHITISTSCIKNLDKLANLPYAIAISLHSPYDSVRKKLVNSKIKIKDIVKFAQKVSEKRNKRTILVQYALIKRVNDRNKDIKKIISYKWPKRTMFNILEFNETGTMKRADKEKFIKFKEGIIRAGWKCFTRQARGKDIEAACGMLE
jgi:23S rRNA (adenine2503-C2)-methyltransferase